MTMRAFLLDEIFQPEVILTLDIFTSGVGDQGYNGAFLWTSVDRLLLFCA